MYDKQRVRIVGIDKKTDKDRVIMRATNASYTNARQKRTARAGISP